MVGPLAGVRALDLSDGLAGPFCARLLADLGADVLKVERPRDGASPANDGTPANGLPPEARGSYLYVNTSKRGITLDLDSAAGRNRLGQLVQRWDVVIAGDTEPALAAGGLGLATLREWNPSVILTTVTSFGSDGPYRNYQSTHLIACALGGWSINCGVPEREPLQVGGSISDFIAGAYGAVATIAAIEARAKNGRGDHVDVSTWEAMAAAALPMIMTLEHVGWPGRHSSEVATGPSFIMPCAEGHVGVNLLTGAHWEMLCLFVGRPDLMEDPRFRSPRDRLLKTDQVREELASWFAARAAEDVFHEAQTWRLPFGLVPTPAQVFSLLPHRERGFFVDMDDPLAGPISVPGLPFRMSATPTVPTRAPLVGEHDEEVSRQLAVGSRGGDDFAQSVSGNSESSLLPTASPLAGVRILDLSMFMAGPMVTLLAADLGAEVIKIESVQRIDGWRGAAVVPGVERPWEASTVFNWVNRNKRGITLNLDDPRGADLFRRMVASADALVENYTPRVMANFGLDYERLRPINPRLVMLSMPGYGMTGSWRDYTAFAWPTEQMAGISQLTGYADGPPLFGGTTGGDPLAGLMGAVALVAALHHQRRTGDGQHIDLSQLEAATMFVGDVLIEVAQSGRDRVRNGNRHPAMAAHGNYPCRDGGWIAIACRTDAEWHALSRLIGREDLVAAGSPWVRTQGRLAGVDALDQLVAGWTRSQDALALMHRLQAEGIPAGAVLDGADMRSDPHLNARRFFVEQSKPGTPTKAFPGEPFRFAETPLPDSYRAPLLGEHTRDVLADILGLNDETLAALERDDVIGTVPLAARVAGVR